MTEPAKQPDNTADEHKPELDAHSTEEDILDEALDESFPASDPISVTHAVRTAKEHEEQQSDQHKP